MAEDALRIYVVGGDPSSRETIILAGRDVGARRLRVLHDPVDMSLLAESELVVRALGIVVHSEDQRARIEQRWFGPVGRIHEPIGERRDTAGRSAAELLAFLERAAVWRPGLALDLTASRPS